LEIREAKENDFEEIWPLLKTVIEAGESYPYPKEMSKEEARVEWMSPPKRVFVAVLDAKVIGTYYIKPNQSGRGSHVCNCGYIVSSEARGQGVATRLCIESQKKALELGFKAMQFNLVVSTNEPAVHLWSKLGFQTVGHLPKAFLHANQGYVDALVMYKWLDK
jgi:RimJ/RimL family protein N-acetyltransferase